MLQRISSVVLLFLAACLAQQSTSNRPTPLVEPKMAGACAVVGGKAYVLGGMNNQQRLLDAVEEYDPATNKWAVKKPMPQPLASAAAAASEKTVYRAGGRAGGLVLNALAAYDPSTNSWSSKKPMKTARWNHMAAVVGSKLYVIGGIAGVGNQRRPLDDVEIYDPGTDTWTTGRPLPTPVQSSAVAVAGGKIYIIGGRAGTGDAGSATNEVVVYDPRSNSWTSGKAMGAARTGSQAVVHEGRIFVVGGAAAGSSTSSIEVYDPAANTWSSHQSMGSPRTGHCVAVLSGILYVYGGATASSAAAITANVERMPLPARKSQGTVR